MIRLAVLLVAVQSVELALYLQAPHLEANPLMAALGPAGVVVAKVAGVALVLLIASRIRTRPLRDAALLVAIGVGLFGAGSELVVLTSGATASAPAPLPAHAFRRFPQPAAQTIPPAGWGFDEADPGRQTAVPGTPEATAERPTVTPMPDTAPSPSIGKRPARTEAPATAKPSRAHLTGTATWYAYRSGQAAAGAGLRAAIGRGWRGTHVTVNGIPAVLTDWMGTKDPAKIIDLDDGLFRAACGPLSRGVCRVVVRW